MTSPTVAGSGTRTPPFGTVTVTIASPAVFSFTAHGLNAGDQVVFTTTGALPTGLTAGTVYYVIAAGLTANAFEVSATPGGSAVNTSVSQSGTHTMTPEVVLFDSSAVGTYVAWIDPNVMAAGDVIELRIYRMVVTGGTRRVVYEQSYKDAQFVDDMLKVSQPVGCPITDAGAYRYTLKQTAGTARAFVYAVDQY